MKATNQCVPAVALFITLYNMYLPLSLWITSLNEPYHVGVSDQGKQRILADLVVWLGRVGTKGTL